MLALFSHPSQFELAWPFALNPLAEFPGRQQIPPLIISCAIQMVHAQAYLAFGCHVLILFALGADRFVLAFEGGHDGVPGEDGAFHTGRIFMDTGEHGEFADIAFNLAGHDHFVDAAEHIFHVGFGFALGKFREEGRGGLGDAAAGTDEADVGDFIAVEDKKEFELVAAEGIVALGGEAGLRHFVEIARLLAVVKDDLLVKVVDVFEHAFNLAQGATPPSNKKWAKNVKQQGKRSSNRRQNGRRQIH
jgi:hypothetical protein